MEKRRTKRNGLPTVIMTYFFLDNSNSGDKIEDK